MAQATGLSIQFNRSPVSQKQLFAIYVDTDSRMHFGTVVRHEFLIFAEDLRSKGLINRKTENSAIQLAFAEYLSISVSKLLQWARGDTVPVGAELRQALRGFGFDKHQIEPMVKVTDIHREDPSIEVEPVDDPFHETPAGLPYFIITPEIKRDIEREKKRRKKENKTAEPSSKESSRDKSTNATRRRMDWAKVLISAFASVHNKEAFLRAASRGVPAEDITRALAGGVQLPANDVLEHVEQELREGGWLSPDAHAKFSTELRTVGRP